jgi:hypothetical protein
MGLRIHFLLANNQAFWLLKEGLNMQHFTQYSETIEQKPRQSGSHFGKGGCHHKFGSHPMVITSNHS